MPDTHVRDNSVRTSPTSQGVTASEVRNAPAGSAALNPQALSALYDHDHIESVSRGSSRS